MKRQRSSSFTRDYRGGKRQNMGIQRPQAKTSPGRSYGQYTVARTRGPNAAGLGEMKYSDSYVSGSTIPESTDWSSTVLDPSTANCLFSPIQGNDINNREGRKVNLYKLKIRGVISGNAINSQATVTQDQTAIRFMVVQDTQTNGSQMTGGQLMAAPGAATTLLTFTTFQSLVNLGRFKVLKDKVFWPSPAIVVNNTTASTVSQVMADIPFKFTFVFKKPIVVRFNATNGGTISDIIDNSFHVVAQASGTGGSHQVSYTCRGCFKE